MKDRSEQAVNDPECSVQVFVLYLRCSGKLFKVLWLVNYLFYKDYFGSNAKGDLQQCFQNFPNNKNNLQVIVNT